MAKAIFWVSPGEKVVVLSRNMSSGLRSQRQNTLCWISLVLTWSVLSTTSSIMKIIRSPGTKALGTDSRTSRVEPAASLYRLLADWHPPQVTYSTTLQHDWGVHVMDRTVLVPPCWLLCTVFRNYSSVCTFSVFTKKDDQVTVEGDKDKEGAWTNENMDFRAIIFLYGQQFNRQ